ncbi:DUF1579 family protein [Cryptosporangium minutisporangium]|uniref:DUF1579 domain-containing protein n=1 Tax=Cryptosporangium minutisporangium TaxID=113569 RepID=A0ABP6SV34_9ACTN
MDNPDLKPFEPLVGLWRSSGRTVPGRFGPAVEIEGTDAYEWLGDGFLVHHVDVRMGDEQVRVIELIGEYDPASRTYAMRAFDNAGTVSVMRASVDADGVWTFADASTRAVLTITADGGTMAARWERTDEDGNWHHWIDMQFARA